MNRADPYRQPLPAPLMALRARALRALYGPRAGDARDRVHVDGLDLLVEDELLDPRPRVGFSPWSYLGRGLDVRPGERVLALGDDAGLVAIHAASRGAKVRVVDDREAVRRCALRNSQVAGQGAPETGAWGGGRDVAPGSLDLVAWVPGWLTGTDRGPARLRLDVERLAQDLSSLIPLLGRGGRILFPFPDVDAVPSVHATLREKGLRWTLHQPLFRPVWGPTRLYRAWPAPPGVEAGLVPVGVPMFGAAWVAGR